MFKIAGRVLDFYDDPKFISNMTAQALFGKSLVPPEKVDQLRDKDFAVKIATDAGDVRRWPIYNALSTRLSGSYFGEAMKDLPDEIRNTAGYHLKLAHVRHGVKLPTFLNEPFPRPEGNVVKLANNGEMMEAPDPRFMSELSQEYFLENMGRFSPEERFQKANEIFEICKLAGTKVDSRIWNYVEKERIGPYFKDELLARHTLVKEAGEPIMRETFEASLSTFRGMNPKKVAETLVAMDKLAGLDKKWDKGLRDPYEAVFGGLSMEKTASSEEDVFKWKLNTLAVNPKALSEVFSPEFVTKFTNDPAGTYKTADPMARRVLTTIMNRLPSPSGSVKPSLMNPPPKSDNPVVGATICAAEKIIGS